MLETTLAENLAAARRKRGLSQAELAQGARLQRQQITYYETGARVPGLQKLLRLARAFDLSVQALLYGSDRVGGSIREIAIELRSLGLIDLRVEAPVVPGAFRRPEEVVARAVAGKEPEARIVEGVPAILSWNRWNPLLLWAFAREAGRAAVYRLAWLADVALTLERASGFPGGCPGREELAEFVRRVKTPPKDRWDDLGRPSETPPSLPSWKRWRIRYAADLATFRQRAEHLVALAEAEGRERPGRGE